MFQLSLTKRIWFSFIALIVIIGLIVGLIYPFSLQNALRADSFQLIKQVQLRMVPNLKRYTNGDVSKSLIQGQQAARSVSHLILWNGLQIVVGEQLRSADYNEMLTRADKQKDDIGQYELDYKGGTMFYVVRKVQDGYLISYMQDTYTKQMVNELWMKLLLVFLWAGLIALAFAAWLTRYLKEPLNALGRRFEEIAKLNWRKPFEWKSGDEFQRLSNQFENMRRNLVRYDDSQRQFLQRASHELKTPIMVIQSYAQSVKDGIYPAKDLDGTMEIILDEAILMEKRVKKLMYFTRVDSLRDEMPDLERVRFGDIAVTVKDRLSNSRPEVRITITGEDTELYVDEEQWLIVLENLIENAMRYAEHTIHLDASLKADKVLMSIQNDGEPIPEDQVVELFEPFKKGKKGQFGLGLAIVKRIVERHDGEITLSNQPDGVTFEIIIPSN